MNNHSLITALQNKAIYDHPVSHFKVIETHCAWVLLTGAYAYKIKKPLDLGFLDFSTLAQRHHACTEEIRLNRRLAPAVYLEVVPITGSICAPQLNGDGEIIEYAVKMRQFEANMEFDQLIKRGALTQNHIDELARRTATFHQSLKSAAADTAFGSPETIEKPMLENFSQISALLPHGVDRSQLKQLQEWTVESLQQLSPELKARKEQGFIRECHGDLHLANITYYQNSVMLFDCLEFSPELRWIDQISEIAFMVMDLDAHGRSDLGFRFLNGWLQQSGDYSGVPLLRLYLVYRAMVRAKVAAIQHTQHPTNEHWQQCQRYLQLATAYTQRPPTPLMITHGLSGSGKSTISQLILEQFGAIRVRSDVERKRLHGLTVEARSKSSIGGEIYTETSSEATYQQLALSAAAITAGGYPAIIDATFLKLSLRHYFKKVAVQLKVPFLILHFHADEKQLRTWITERNAKGDDPSEADVAVLTEQIKTEEPLTEEELNNTVKIDSSLKIDVQKVCENIRDAIA